MNIFNNFLVLLITLIINFDLNLLADDINNVYEYYQSKIDRIQIRENSIRKKIYSIEKKLDKFKKRYYKFVLSGKLNEKQKDYYLKKIKKYESIIENYKNELRYIITLKMEYEKRRFEPNSKPVKISKKEFMNKSNKTKTKHSKPLDKFIILEKYGVVYDPKYKISYKNSNVKLKVIKKPSAVKSVMNGIVETIKKTNYLKYVVIIKHPNDYTTIYASIDKISPNIYRGKPVKAGEIIGYVYNNLIFEINHRGNSINPMKYLY